MYRYFDDLFLAFDSSEDSDDSFNTLNSIHCKIQFTSKQEVENQIALLDAHTRKTMEGVETKNFKLPTFSELYINWQTLCSS